LPSIGDDNDDFIFVGRSRDFVAQRDGVLFLGVNEGNLSDNSGFSSSHRSRGRESALAFAVRRRAKRRRRFRSRFWCELEDPKRCLPMNQDCHRTPNRRETSPHGLASELRAANHQLDRASAVAI